MGSKIRRTTVYKTVVVVKNSRFPVTLWELVAVCTRKSRWCTTRL
jgi:hypothetical protein